MPTEATGDSTAGARPPTVSLVLLTMGDRPREMTAALESAVDQVDLTWAEVLVVFNGVPEQPVPDGATAISTPDNAGIPEGRNIGLAHTTGDVVVFLDDDARFESDRSVARVVHAFGQDDRLGAVGFRLVDEDGETAARHVPRVGGRHPDRAGEVTGFLGGAVAVRRAAFVEAGGYAGEFFYSMEESDLALGIIDVGYRVRYEPSVRVFHPRTEPSRHPSQIEKTARNRVLFARRRLPWMLGVVYVSNWLVITAVRQRLRPGALRSHWRGTIEGVRTPTAHRRPIRWSTVWRLSRLGRPPVI